MKTVGISIFLAIVGVAVVVLVFLSQPISRTKDTPLVRAVSMVHQICSKLRYYADGHSDFPGGESTITNIDALVAVGILSADDVTFLRHHSVVYHGFDLRRIAADVQVFETVFTNTSTPRRIIGYSDGHVITLDLNAKP